MNLFGLDKTVLYQPIGGFILSYFPQFTDILGLRISLIGELYISFGLSSVIVIIFSMIGIILVLLDNAVQSTKLRAILTSLLMLSIPYGSIYFITVIQIFIVSLVVEKILIKLVHNKLSLSKESQARFRYG